MLRNNSLTRPFDGVILSVIDMKKSKMWADTTPCEHTSCIESERRHYNDDVCTCDVERYESPCSCNTTCACNSD